MMRLWRRTGWPKSKRRFRNSSLRAWAAGFSCTRTYAYHRGGIDAGMGPSRSWIWAIKLSNMSFRREALLKYGMFRTDLGRTHRAPAMGEETELMFRLRLNRERLVYYPRAIVYHCPCVERLSKKYLRRWFYHYGISLHQIDLVRFRSGRWLGSVPLWRYRWAGDVLGSAALIWIKGGSRERFHQELRVICLMGYSASALNQQLQGPIRVKS